MAFVAGILLASVAEMWVWCVCGGVCFLVAAISLLLRGPISWLYVGFSVLFFGAVLARLHEPQSIVAQGVRLPLEVVLEDHPVWRGGRAMHSDGRIVSERGRGEKLLVAFDTMYRFGLGDRVRFTGYVNPIDSLSSSYARLMRARGFTGRTYISRFSNPSVSSDRGRFFFKRLQASATQRLDRVHLSSDERAVAAAMTVGARREISRELRTAYSRTGTAHLLAVSGLHVGIIFLIINGLLYLLPLFRGGRLLKNFMAVVAIWVYAALSGMSPSVLRAAAMFTGAQLAVALSVTRSPVNILCGTAVVLLALRPGLVFDIGFQLSMLAVAGIMCWFPTLYRFVTSRWRALNVLWSTIIIGAVASLATMPLVSHTFGVISPLGVLLNPIVMLTAWAIVGFSAFWIALPIPLLEPVFRWLIGLPAWLQNTVIQSVSRVPGVAIEYTLPFWGTVGVYAIFTGFTIWLLSRQKSVMC